MLETCFQVGDYDARSFGFITSGFFDRTSKWELWLRLFLVEHCVLLLRVIILSISPSSPRWIAEAKAILTFRIAYRYKTAEQIAKEQSLKDQYEAKMQSGVTQSPLVTPPLQRRPKNQAND